MTILPFPSNAKEVKRKLAVAGFEAEFFVDTWSSPDAPIYHYIVTKIGVPGILGCGQEKTAYDVERQALDCMRHIYRRSLAARSTG